MQKIVYNSKCKVRQAKTENDMSAENLNHFTDEYKNILKRCKCMKQYECGNVVQVAHKVADLTNTRLDRQTWKNYCYEVKKDGSSWFDYTAFDFKGNEFDVSIFLGYDQQSRHYFVSVDFEKLEKELTELEDTHIDEIKKFKEKAVLNSSYGEATESITVYQFERLTRTLYKSLFKAIGIEETRKIPFIISNNMVFFNYNDTQYKYYPSQCKVFKKCGRKYQRINWKNFGEESNPDGQKQNGGRSPPFTPDIRSINIDKFRIKE